MWLALALQRGAPDQTSPLGNPTGELQLLAAGDSAAVAGDMEKALQNYTRLCGRADPSMSAAQKRACIDAHAKAGDILYDSGDFAGALDFYLKGLELSDKTGDKPFMGLLYKDIGNVYNMYGELGQAVRQYKEGLKYSADDPKLSLRLCNNLVTTYAVSHDVENARHYYDEARRIRCEWPTGEFLNDFNHALILHEEGRYVEAADLLKETAAYARAHDLEPRYLGSAYEKLYRVYERLGMRDSMFAYMNRCMDLATEQDMTRLFTETYRSMADFYEKEGDKERALQLRSQYLQVRDSIFNVRRFDMLKSRQLMYETDKVDRELREHKEREQRYSELIRWQWAVIIVATVAALSVAALLVNVYRNKRRLDTSYRNLYKVNRRYAENYRKSAERERGLAEELESAVARVAELERREAKASADRPPEPAAPDSSGSGGDGTGPAKYSSSRLDKTRHSELLAKIARVMEDGEAYCSADFSLNTLAALVGSNSRYVSQIINEAYGKNFSSYVNEFRIRLACERLADTKGYGLYTIRAIGESVGFKSHTTFLGVFKKITGMTPSVYSRMAKDQTE